MSDNEEFYRRLQERLKYSLKPSETKPHKNFENEEEEELFRNKYPNLYEFFYTNKK